jgi:hypothetical protein
MPSHGRAGIDGPDDSSAAIAGKHDRPEVADLREASESRNEGVAHPFTGTNVT